MTVSEQVFSRAWLLLKTQPDGVQFTSEEKSFILGTILKMMNSSDLRMQEEAGNLFVKYSRL